MNLKKLALILVVLLGGMAIYYNMSVSDNANVNTNSDNASKVQINK